MPPALFFFLRIALAFWGLLQFHTNFRIVYFFVKNAIGLLIRLALNLSINLGSMNILTKLLLPIQERDISFHLFTSPVYFLNIS